MRTARARPLATLLCLSALPMAAPAAVIQLTATGVNNNAIGGAGIYNGSSTVPVADGTPITIVFLIDTDQFPASIVDGNGATLYNAAGSGGCRGISLPQAPLLPSMISASVSVGGTPLETQSSGNARNCDFASIDDSQGTGDGLVVQQDAYNGTLHYYTDGTYATESLAPTEYSIQEVRVNRVTISGILANDPFSPAELPAELAQPFTVDGYYGMTLGLDFSRSRYICAPGYCTNEPVGAGMYYNITGSVTGLTGQVVPAPATLGLFGTALASLVLRRRRRA